MFTRIPNDQYKRFELKDMLDVPAEAQLTVTGYKSRTPQLIPDKKNKKCMIADHTIKDPDGAEICLCQGQFKLTITGVKNLTKLKEAIEFALEMDENGSKNQRRQQKDSAQ